MLNETIRFLRSLIIPDYSLEEERERQVRKREEIIAALEAREYEKAAAIQEKELLRNRWPNDIKED